MTVDGTPDSERAFEEFPFDFCGYLARLRGISREAATSELGRWLARYESAEPETRAAGGVRRCRSGFFPAPGRAGAIPFERSGAA